MYNLILLFRFISVFECEENAELEDYASLALAADHFLMEPLRELCCSKIEELVTAENVWPTLNSTCFAPKVSAACSKVINTSNIKISGL